MEIPSSESLLDIFYLLLWTVPSWTEPELMVSCASYSSGLQPVHQESSFQRKNLHQVCFVFLPATEALFRDRFYSYVPLITEGANTVVKTNKTKYLINCFRKQLQFDTIDVFVG